MSPQHRHDVYDDTGTRHGKHRSSRSRRSDARESSRRSDAREPSHRSGKSSRRSGGGESSRHPSRALAVRDEQPTHAPANSLFDDMLGLNMPAGMFGLARALDGFEHAIGEMERNAQNSGMFGGVDRTWGEMERAALDGNAMPSGSAFYYESTKSTMGADGRVHRETVRTQTGSDGRLETKRVVRDADGRETETRSPGELPPSPFTPGGLIHDFANFGAMHPQPPPPARVEEITEKEDRRARRKSSKKSKQDMQRIVVEEPDEEPVVENVGRMKRPTERSERGDKKERKEQRVSSNLSFFERARNWGSRA